MDASSTLVLKPRDRIVFLGDSITEQQLYTNYVENYLAGRYPELKLSFFNAGWGGDTAPGGARRLDRDVLNLKPTVVTVCYGMNDGGYCPPSEEIRANFRGGMRDIVARLKAAGVRVVLLTPGMADVIANPWLGTMDYNRSGLRVMADEVLKLAREEGLPCADLHKIMNAADARGKAADPKFCMMPDGFHPEPPGQLCMAFGVLQALGVPPLRRTVTLDCAARTATGSDGVSAGRLRRHEAGFTLDLSVESLPFFVEPAARKVLPFLPFQETFNNLTLVIRNLPAAHASLRSAGGARNSFPREELEAGVSLSSQWLLPPLRLAEEVHRFTAEKDQIDFRLWRVLALDVQNPSYHNAHLHKAAIRLSADMDRGRAHLLRKPGRNFSLHVVAADDAASLLLDGDFIGDWNLLGHFPKPYDRDMLGGEAAWTAAVPALGPEWITASPEWPAANALVQAFGPRTDCFAYAATTLESPVAQRAELLLGSDDGVAAWLNGAPVHNNLAVFRGLTPDADRIPVDLKAGVNVLLLKISQGNGEWGYCARFAGLTRPLRERRPRR